MKLFGVKPLRSKDKCTSAQMLAHQRCFIESAFKACARQPEHIGELLKYVQEVTTLSPPMQFRNEFNQEFTEKICRDPIAAAFFSDTLYFFYANAGDESNWSDKLCARLVEAFQYSGPDKGVGSAPRIISLSSANNTMMEALAWKRTVSPIQSLFGLFKPRINQAEVLHIFLRNNRHLIFSALILLTAEEIIAKLTELVETQTPQSPK